MSLGYIIYRILENKIFKIFASIILVSLITTYFLLQGSSLLWLIALAVPLIVLIQRKFENIFLLLLISYSFVFPVLQLPYSDLTYLRFDDIIWILFIVLSLLRISSKKEKILHYPYFKPLILLCIIILLSSFQILYGSQEKYHLAIYNSLWYQMRFFQGVAVLLITSILFPNRLRKKCLQYIFAFGFILSIIGIFQFLKILPIYHYHKLNIHSTYSINSLLSFNSAHLGAYLIAASFFGLEIFESIKRGLGKYFILFLNIAILACLIYTSSRASWFGWIGGFMFFALYKRGFKKRILWLIFIGILLITFMSLPTLRNNIYYNIGEKRIESATHRLNAYKLTLNYLSNNPRVLFWGVGFMDWRYSLYGITTVASAHNNYLDVLAELGILGLIIFCWFWTLIFKMSKKLSNEKIFGGRSFSAILIGYFVASLSGELIYPVWSLESFFSLLMLMTGIVLSSYHKNLNKLNHNNI